MPKLKTIVLVHTTADKSGANSPSKFTLEITKPNGKADKSIPDNQGQRARGKLDTYSIDVSTDNVNSDDEAFSIVMRIQSDDAWLPQSISVLGQTSTGRIVLLGYHPQWKNDDGTEKWFDRGSDAIGIEAHVISS